MKANRDDAPEHIKNKRKSPIGAAGITAVGLILGILFMAERNGWMDFAKHMIKPPGQNQQITSTATLPISNTPNPNPKPEDLFWQNVEAEKQKQPAPSQPPVRQTSFNDSNYRPKTVINTIQPPPRQYAQARSQPVPNRQQQTLNGRRETILRWEGTRNDHYWWKGQYRWNNNIINYDDLCRSSNFPKKGSIEYRGCRRAAKEYLRDECRAGRNKSQELRRVYCHAEDAFRH